MRLVVSGAVLGSVLALSALAARGADLVQGTRGLLVERGHDVELTFERGHATLVVTRTLENLGERHDQAELSLDLPEAAVAVRLQTRGLLDGRPRWFEGELMEAEAAAAKYKELTGIGGYFPKDPALLSWRAQGELALQVFPLPPGERKQVRYTLVLPARYEAGRHVLKLPRLGSKTHPARVVLRAARPGDRLYVGGQPFPDGGVVTWPGRPRDGEGDGDGEDEGLDSSDDSGGDQVQDDLAVALEPAAAPRFDMNLGVRRFAPGRALVRYAVRAAPRLSRTPRGAQVVVLLDVSRSLDEAAVQAEVSAARATLHHFVDARVDVLSFTRHVESALGGFVPVERAQARLAALAPTRGNGSALDAALRRADQLLRTQPAGPARRVVLFTDLRTRAALDPATLRSALAGSGALLHIVSVDGVGGEPALTRSDDAPWSAVARATGGLLWSGTLSEVEEARAALERVTEELARPMRVHALKVRVPGLELAPDEGGEALEQGQLDEGEGVAGLQIAPAEAPWLELTGELWSRSVKLRVAPDPAEGRRWSALVFGTELLGALSEPEMMVLARHGRAVSPVTSYLAIEPGVRPSTEGLAEGEGFGGLLGLTSGITCGGGVGEGVPSSFDHEGWLRDQIATLWRACGGQRTATVELETTFAEIVDVLNVTTDDAKAGACLREGVWGLELPDQFTEASATWTVPV